MADSRGAVASATWLNERRVAQIYLRQRIRLRRPRGSANYCYKAISLTPLVEPNKKEKKLLFFPFLRNSFQQFQTALKPVSVCLLSKTHPVGAEKGLFFYTKEKKKPWAFEDRANLQARSENQPGDDIPPCWR